MDRWEGRARRQGNRYQFLDFGAARFAVLANTLAWACQLAQSWHSARLLFELG